MTAEGEWKRLMVVRSELEQACALLASPSAAGLDRCSAVLTSAGSALLGCQPWLGEAQGDHEALLEAHRLHQTVRRASDLLQNAWQFFAKWNQMREALNAGYTPFGEPPAQRRHGLVCLTG